jgi:hypothetical protein
LDIFIEKNSQLHERFPDKWRSKDFNSFQAYALSDKANIALVRGRINEAETLIDQALELSSRSAAARMIDLKIRCTSRPGLAENRKLFDDTVSMLKNEIDDAKDEQGKKNARMMYIYFSEDYQLKKLCGFD